MGVRGFRRLDGPCTLAPIGRGLAPAALVGVAVLIGRQLVVGEAALVLRGALLVQLCLGALAGRFLLGDPGALLGGVCALGAGARLLAVLADRLLTTLLELTLLRPEPGAFAHPRHRERQHGDDD